ncbi:MAG: trypsin-like peptidase domain-containing protein, partial [Nitrososphaeraceae archaeon]
MSATIIISVHFFLFVVLICFFSLQTQKANSIELKDGNHILMQTMKNQLNYNAYTNSSLSISNNSSSILQPQTISNLSSSILNTIFKETQDSVVQITRTVPQTGMIMDPLQENRTALGSGFLFDKKGHIITNSHVVGDAMTVDVTFTNGDRLRANVTAL